MDIKEKVLQPLNIVMYYAQDGEPITVSARVYRIKQYTYYRVIELGDISKSIYLRMNDNKGYDLHPGDLIVATGIKQNNHIIVDDYALIGESGWDFDIKEHREEQKKLLLKNQINEIIINFMKQHGFMHIISSNANMFVYETIEFDIPRAFIVKEGSLELYSSYSTHIELRKLLLLLINTIQMQTKLRIAPSEMPEYQIASARPSNGMSLAQSIIFESFDNEDKNKGLTFQDNLEGKDSIIWYNGNNILAKSTTHIFKTRAGVMRSGSMTAEADKECMSFSSASLEVNKFLQILLKGPIMKEENFVTIKETTNTL